MRRFNYDENDDYSREVEKFFGGPENPENEQEEFGEISEELQVGLMYRELNYETVKQAIRFAEKSFWWRFYSINTRLDYIEKIYLKLKGLEESA